jgi:glycerol kinase
MVWQHHSSTLASLIDVAPSLQQRRALAISGANVGRNTTVLWQHQTPTLTAACGGGVHWQQRHIELKQ